jgi:hypothetical protein
VLDLTPIQPIAAIIGALITAAAAVCVALFITRKQKRITFWVEEPEDLNAALRKEAAGVRIMVGDQEVRQLCRCQITLRNTGNDTITNVSFEVSSEYLRRFLAASPASDQVDVAHSFRAGAGVEPGRLTFTFAFFNSKEVKRVVFLYDGPIAHMELACRLEGVSVKVKRGVYVSFGEAVGSLGGWERILGTFASVSGASAAVAAALTAVTRKR